MCVLFLPQIADAVPEKLVEYERSVRTDRENIVQYG